MSALVVFVVTFVVIFLLYLFLVILNNKKKSRIFETSQAMLIIKASKLDISKISKNEFALVLSLANSFIVAFTLMVSDFFDNYIIKLVVCFVLLVLLILVIYRLIGIVYKKKEGKKNV